MASQYMTVREAQEYLGISKRTMTLLLKAGKLTADKDPVDGRIKRIRRDEVEKLAAESTRRGKEAA